jgi:hypothetical protein
MAAASAALDTQRQSESQIAVLGFVAMDPLAPSALWSVHSEKDGRPAICAWAASKADAEAKMAALAATNAGYRYWVVQLTLGQVEDYKNMGFIPKGA